MLPFHFATGTNVEALRKNHWRGAIVGPHGSGKSTLVMSLMPQLEQAGCAVQLITLHAGQTKLPKPPKPPASKIRPPTSLAANIEDNSYKLIIIDGFEQLSRFQRWRIVRRSRRRGHGLLVTVHEDRSAARLPILFRTSPSLEMLERLVATILNNHDVGGVIGQDDVTAAYQSAKGNLREALFKLFDVFELRNRRSEPAPEQLMGGWQSITG
jgi:ABC-type dipeptide/oligopeptide/nickel transport system ATPase component